MLGHNNMYKEFHWNRNYCKTHGDTQTDKSSSRNLDHKSIRQFEYLLITLLNIIKHVKKVFYFCYSIGGSKIRILEFFLLKKLISIQHIATDSTKKIPLYRSLSLLHSFKRFHLRSSPPPRGAWRAACILHLRRLPGLCRVLFEPYPTLAAQYVRTPQSGAPQNLPLPSVDHQQLPTPARCRS